ncbi:MAG: serine hydrolase domain-containing protein [Bacteroidota bacterium]
MIKKSKIWFFKKNALWLFFLFSVVACQNAKQTENSLSAESKQPFYFFNKNEHIIGALDSLVENKFLPYVYARIENHDGALLFEHSAVNRELYPDLEVTGDSWFRIWSMSKIVTISLVMDLSEDGILNLNDPVHQYIPEFKNLQVALSADGKAITDYAYDEVDEICPVQYIPANSEMTIADLIHHKAGFYYPWSGIDCLDKIWTDQDLNAAKNSQELINRLKAMPLVQQPGSTYFYGLNTTVLGLVAERATDKPLNLLVKERITGPMKINGLQYTEPAHATLLPRTDGKQGFEKINVKNETDIFGAAMPKYSPDHSLFMGGEGMIGTTDGYADFMRMLLHNGSLNGHRFLNEATINEMSSPHTQTDSPWGYNGYNLWVTGDTLKVMGVGEAGFWVSGGYEGTYCWIDRKRKIVGLVMTQLFNMKTAPSEVFRGAVYQEIWKHEQEQE